LKITPVPSAFHPCIRHLRLLLIMALAMYWCVRVGQEEARDHPTPLEKIQAQTDPDHWTFRKLARSAVSWFKRGLRVLER